MSWNMPEGTSPLDYERSEEGLNARDETWRNDEEDREPGTGDRNAQAGPQRFDMVSYANDALWRNVELNRHLGRLYSENAPRRKPAQMELGENTREDAA